MQIYASGVRGHLVKKPVRDVASSFFQAEDGIRDLTVTGVQTCALPISSSSPIVAGAVDIPSSFGFYPVLIQNPIDGILIATTITTPRGGVETQCGRIDHGISRNGR